MPMIFTDYAVARMFEQKITVEMVQKIVVQPDGVLVQSMDKEIRFRKFRDRTDNLIAAVVVNSKTILTVLNNFEVKK